MTTQALITAQSIGAGSNKGDGILSISAATLAAATSAYIINVQLTNPSSYVPDKNQIVTVWYTTTMRTVTAANAPKTLAQTARYVDIRPGQVASIVVSKDSALEVKTGTNLHVWCDVPTFTTSLTLDVDVVECPS